MNSPTTDHNYEKTIVLLAKAQHGDATARDELYRRLIPRLERYAHGRVPLSMRGMADTQEIVQDTVLRSLPRLEEFKPRHEGALMQYLKQILKNRVRDLARRGGRETPIQDESLIASKDELSPVSRAVGNETLGKFEEALQSLKEDQRIAVSLHVEMGYSLGELSEALERNPEAARKVLFRGLQNVASKMRALL